MTDVQAPAEQRLHPMEPAAFRGIWNREATNFTRFWRSSTFGSIVEPTINLLAFGFGFGALVSTVQGIPYIQFVGTGAVATAVLFSSVFAGMYDRDGRRVLSVAQEGLFRAPKPR